MQKKTFRNRLQQKIFHLLNYDEWPFEHASTLQLVMLTLDSAELGNPELVNLRVLFRGYVASTNISASEGKRHLLSKSMGHTFNIHNNVYTRVSKSFFMSAAPL